MDFPELFLSITNCYELLWIAMNCYELLWLLWLLWLLCCCIHKTHATCIWCVYIYTHVCMYIYIYDVSSNSHAETRIHKCLSWYWKSSDKSMWLYNVNIFISTVERRHVTIHCNSVCFDWISHDLPAVRACKHQLSCTSNSIGCGWEAAAQVPTVKK